MEIIKSVYNAIGRLLEMRRLILLLKMDEDGDQKLKKLDVDGHYRTYLYSPSKLVSLAHLQDSGILGLPKLRKLELYSWDGSINAGFKINSAIRTLTISHSECSNRDLKDLCELLPSSLFRLEIQNCSDLTKRGIYDILECRQWRKLEQLAVHLDRKDDTELTDYSDVFSTMPKLRDLHFSRNLFNPKDVASTSINRLTINSPIYSVAQVILLAHQLRPTLKELTLQFKAFGTGRRPFERVDAWPEMDKIATAVRDRTYIGTFFPNQVLVSGCIGRNGHQIQHSYDMRVFPKPITQQHDICRKLQLQEKVYLAFYFTVVNDRSDVLADRSKACSFSSLSTREACFMPIVQ